MVDDRLQICRITTSLTKKINRKIDIWKSDVNEIKSHKCECIIDNDKGLIKLIRENYLVFYDPANDIKKSYMKSPRPTPYENTGYFWALNIHDKGRIPLARLIWSYKYRQEIPNGYVIDHGNDMKFLNTYANLSLLTHRQNISKLRYHKRVAGQYSVTMVSHFPTPIKLLRFKDDEAQTQELLIYNTEDGIEPLLNDLNSFKEISKKEMDISAFKNHFEHLKASSKNYMAYMKQPTTGDSFTDEIFLHSIDWQKINQVIGIERFTALAS